MISHQLWGLKAGYCWLKKQLECAELVT